MDCVFIPHHTKQNKTKQSTNQKNMSSSPYCALVLNADDGEGEAGTVGYEYSLRVKQSDPDRDIVTEPVLCPDSLEGGCPFVTKCPDCDAILAKKVPVPECVSRLIKINESLPAQGTREWFDQRKEKVSASVAASVLNCNRFKTYDEFVTERAIGVPNNLPSPAPMKWGIDHEEEAMAHYKLLTGHALVGDVGFICHPQHGDRVGGSPDGVTMCGRLVEIKSPYSFKLTPGNIPEHYRPQVLVLLHTLGLKDADFVQWVPAGWKSFGRPVGYESAPLARMAITSLSLDDDAGDGNYNDWFETVFLPSVQRFDADVEKLRSKLSNEQKAEMRKKYVEKWNSDYQKSMRYTARDRDYITFSVTKNLANFSSSWDIASLFGDTKDRWEAAEEAKQKREKMMEEECYE